MDAGVPDMGLFFAGAPVAVCGKKMGAEAVPSFYCNYCGYRICGGRRDGSKLIPDIAGAAYCFDYSVFGDQHEKTDCPSAVANRKDRRKQTAF